MEVPEGGAVVRMYCTGLGDCFLIGLPAADGETGYVLIDCGVWKATPGAREWMTRIMTHIKETVGERGIDVLVVTHPHWDHLSGFGQAREVFETIPVKEVWLAWTEDETEPLALRLAAEREQAFRAALAAATRLRGLAARAGQPEEKERILAAAQNIDQVLKFMGRTPPDDREAGEEDAALTAAGLTGAGAAGLALGELAAGPGTDDLLAIVKDRVERPRYLKPSTSPVHGHAFLGVRIYALGPPTDPKLLGKDDPSTRPGQSEVYIAPGAGGELPLDEESALLVAAAYDPALGGASEDEPRRQRAFPFDPSERIDAGQAAAHPEHGAFFRKQYGFAQTDPAPEWRRIESDWLVAAAQLALNLDDHVNNTSLVLAFALGEGEDAPVLLFPGDAQVGNWLSWHLLDGDGSFIKDLLGRTVLYKVGHHASHNATLKAKGLEMMTNTARLVAMIPVDEQEAHKPKGKNKDGWPMPYDKLLADLLVRTEGRVLRADQGVSLLEGDRPAGWTEARWQQFLEDTVVVRERITVGGKEVERPFFIQYTVRGSRQ
jgi:hypothetical protein